MFKRRKKPTTSKTRHLITQLNPKSPISEQFRTIRTNIQFSAVDEDIRSILVTSAGPGAGKSIISANLAVVYAQQGMKTLLIDGDLRKPTVHYTFRLGNLRGLSTVLIGESSFGNSFEETAVENLHVLSCGPIPPNPAELLASKRMKELLRSVEEMYDIVVIDTPPVMAVTDAKILSNIVDGAVIVVRSGTSEKEDVKKTYEEIADSNTKILGAILNDVEKEEGSYYYYYGN